MHSIATTSSELFHDTMLNAQGSLTPAFIGIAGAFLSLILLPGIFAPASLPLSLYAIATGLRRQQLAGVVLGAFGLFCAIAALSISHII
jgi:hypothetical protein